MASAVIGQATGKAVGGSIASISAEYNWLTHEEQQDMLSRLEATFTWHDEAAAEAKEKILLHFIMQLVTIEPYMA